MSIKYPSTILMVCISILFLTACLPVSPSMEVAVNAEDDNSNVVSVQELETLLEQKDFTLVNVHIPWQGNIPNTDLQLSYDRINDNLDQLPTNKEAKILVYCLTSGMAKIAVQFLIDLGYSNVWMLEGGTTAWIEAGLPLIME